MSIILAHKPRCKHKCKGDCRHVCCQRAREQEAFDRPREYLFQSQALDNGSQRMARRTKPFSMPTNALSLLSQKRKAQDTLIDDYDGPQDLLSQLDRLTAEEDLNADAFKPLQMSRRSENSLSGGGQAARDEINLGSHRSLRIRPNEADSTAGLSTARNDETTRTTSIGGHRWPETSCTRSALVDDLEQQAERSSALTNERPPQRRFLKSLDAPSWLAGPSTSSSL